MSDLPWRIGALCTKGHLQTANLFARAESLLGVLSSRVVRRKVRDLIAITLAPEKTITPNPQPQEKASPTLPTPGTTYGGFGGRSLPVA